MNSVRCLAPIRRLGLAALIALGGLFASAQASACLIEYAWDSTDVPLKIKIVLLSDTSAPISEQFASFEIITNINTIDERRQQYAQMFADFDQKTNQLFALLADVIRAERDAQMAVVRNLTSIAGIVSTAAAEEDRYTVVFSLPDVPDLITLPVDCLGDCTGTSRSPWAYVRDVPEPPALWLLLAAAAALGLVGLCRRASDRPSA